MAGSPAARLMADRLMDGTLAATLTRYRQAGVSWPAISRILSREHGVSATSDQLRYWAEQLGVDATAEAAS